MEKLSATDRAPSVVLTTRSKSPLMIASTQWGLPSGTLLMRLTSSSWSRRCRHVPPVATRWKPNSVKRRAKGTAAGLSRRPSPRIPIRRPAPGPRRRSAAAPPRGKQSLEHGWRSLENQWHLGPGPGPSAVAALGSVPPRTGPPANRRCHKQKQRHRQDPSSKKTLFFKVLL